MIWQLVGWMFQFHPHGNVKVGDQTIYTEIKKIIEKAFPESLIMDGN
jgi:hypothetical protein